MMRLYKRSVAALLGVGLICALQTPAPANFAIFQTSATSTGLGARALPIGAGGQLLELDIVSDGTKVTTADTYGAWWFNPSTANCGNANRTGCWQQTVTGTNMPVSAQNVLNGGGVYAMRIAPSNSSHWYMRYSGDGCVYSSTTKPPVWTKTNFTCRTANSNDFSTKFLGPYMAVDPGNDLIVYAGSPANGVEYSLDGGNTVFVISTATIPAGTTTGGLTQGGGNIISFDPSSSAISNVWQTIVICSYGNGCYRTTNGGQSGGNWAIMTGGPTLPKHLDVCSNGKVYLVANDSTDNVYMWNAGWNTQSAGSLGNPSQSVACDPGTAGRVVAINSAGRLSVSTNGSTWSGYDNNPVNLTRTATDIPWLGWTNETFMTAGTIKFDPSQSNVLYFAEGIGVWSNSPTNTPTTTAFTSVSASIEQLVTNWIVSPWIAGSKPVIGFWDRPVFYAGSTTAYPSTHGAANPQTDSIVSGWSVDWASSAPGTVVTISDWFSGVEHSGISTDGGQTFTAFAQFPAEVAGGARIGGSIAAATPSNIMWQVSNDGDPYCSPNGGGTWNKQTIGSVPAADPGWHHAYYLKRQNVAADRVNTGSGGTFYIYNDGTGAGPGGIYTTTNGCTSWTRAYASTFPNSNANFQMRSVPGVANELFATAGPQGNPGRANTPTAGQFFYDCTGSTTITCSQISNVLEVWAFGFGKAKTGGSGFPAIYIYGWVNNVLGLWESDDHGATWTQLTGPFPLSLDEVVTVEGDANIYGKVYFGFIGSGVGQFN